MAVDADPAARKLFERPCRKRSSNRAELLTELRPEHGKVRLHAHLHRLDFAELDVFHAQLVTDLFGVGGRSACTLNDHATQRLPELQSGRRSRLTPELDDLADRRHLGKERVVSVARLGPAGEKHRSRCVVRTQDTPHVLRQERHHGRDDLHRPNERVQQDRERSGISVPESPTRAADVPIRQIVDERLEGANERRCPEALVRLGHLHDELIRSRE